MRRLVVMALRSLLPDAQADRVVPPTGFTARLTVISAATMAFLAVFTLALSLAAGRMAERWGDELARASTLRISAPAGQVEVQTANALRVLETTPGVASARALTMDEQRALLAPWFGPDLPIESLPVPQLVEIIEAGDGFDAAGLRLRLQAEAPGAVLDDHSRWRQPLVEAAGRLRALGWLAILMIAGTMGVIITLAANAALSANAQVIAVLRLVGAQDAYIVRAFTSRFTLRTLSGAAAGTLVGCVVLAILPPAQDMAGFLSGLGFRGGQWLWPALIPILGAGVAYAATRAAARRTLREMP